MKSKEVRYLILGVLLFALGSVYAQNYFENKGYSGIDSIYLTKHVSGIVIFLGIAAYFGYMKYKFWKIEKKYKNNRPED